MRCRMERKPLHVVVGSSENKGGIVFTPVAEAKGSGISIEYHTKSNDDCSDKCRTKSNIEQGDKCYTNPNHEYGDKCHTNSNYEYGDVCLNLVRIFFAVSIVTIAQSWSFPLSSGEPTIFIRVSQTQNTAVSSRCFGWRIPARVINLSR